MERSASRNVRLGEPSRVSVSNGEADKIRAIISSDAPIRIWLAILDAYDRTGGFVYYVRTSQRSR